MQVNSEKPLKVALAEIILKDQSIQSLAVIFLSHQQEDYLYKDNHLKINKILFKIFKKLKVNKKIRLYKVYSKNKI